MFELVIAFSFALVVSGACSLFEAVLYSVPTTHVEAMAESRGRSGRIFKELRSNIENPISAILSLNTIAHTAGAAFAGAAASKVFGHQSIGWFSVFFTLCILIFSEVIPKTAGVVHARRLAIFVAIPLKVLTKAMAPATWLCSLVTRIMFKEHTPETVSADELRIMAQLGLQAGNIKPYQKRVIENVLSLGKKTVKDVMTPRTVIFSLSEHLTVKDAYDQVDRWEHSRFPVYDRDPEDIVGLVLTREVFMALSQDKDALTLTELMLPVKFVVESAPLDDVLTQFMGSRQGLFVVLDEYGGIAGLVSLEDILEEILGREIMDEYDQVADKRELARRQRDQLVSGPEK